MQKSSFTFASVLSLMVLLVFSYIAYLGMVYWQQGNMALPIILSVSLIIIVCLCVFFMCKGKATRWRRIGGAGQIIFGLIVLVTFLAASLPFTNFLRVAADADHINQMVSATCDKAIGIDQDYEAYVDQRVENYRSNLMLIAQGKSNRPAAYEKCMGKAPGTTDEQKAENLTKSLRARLLPDSTAAIVSKRHEWLERAKSESVMNPLTPSNINKVSQCVDNWTDNYKDISQESYMGEEDVPEFHVTDFDNSLRQLTSTYATLQAPSAIAIVIALACFAIMLLPYWLTEGDLAAARTTTGFSKGLNKNGKSTQSKNLFTKNNQ